MVSRTRRFSASTTATVACRSHKSGRAVAAAVCAPLRTLLSALRRLVAIMSSTSSNIIVALGTTAALDILLSTPHFAAGALFRVPLPILFVAYCR